MNKRTLQVPDFSNIQAKNAVNKQQNIAKNPVTKAMATDKITQIINQSKIPPNILAYIGKLAEQAIHDPSKYSEFVNYMVQNKLETIEDLQKPDYQMMAMLVTIGKVAETMAGNQQPIQPVSPDQGI